jgi:hypothetical protein
VLAGAALSVAAALILHDARFELHPWLAPDSGGLTLTARF